MVPNQPRKNLFKKLGFLARYGHQPLSDMLRTPTVILDELLEAVETIMREESDQAKIATDIT